MCNFHIVIGKIIIVLDIILIVSQYVFYYCLFHLLHLPWTDFDERYIPK